MSREAAQIWRWGEKIWLDDQKGAVWREHLEGARRTRMGWKIMRIVAGIWMVSSGWTGD
jgi:hypothetical protein